MTILSVGIVSLIALATALGVAALVRIRAEAKLKVRSTHKRARSVRTMRERAPDLEARIKTVLAGPSRKYGEIFTDYGVWRLDRETRLELKATAGWSRLNEFTRSLVVRYLWRVLESLAGGAVVVVDQPPQTWNVEVDSRFRDHGFEWRTFGDGPQFIQET
jgi:hypothetical protein